MNSLQCAYEKRTYPGNSSTFLNIFIIFSDRGILVAQDEADELRDPCHVLRLADLLETAAYEGPFPTLTSRSLIVALTGGGTSHSQCRANLHLGDQGAVDRTTTSDLHKSLPLIFR